VVVRRFEGYVRQARAEAARAGVPPPLLFDFSQNDWGGACRCRACRKVRDREGGDSGSLVRFLNQVADRVAPRHPDVRLATLAYAFTFDPPRELALRPNVVVRLAALYDRDFSRPVTDPINRSYRRAIEAWRERTEHLWIWDYAVAFGEGSNVPAPNLPVMAQDLRAYREQGVEGVFYQFDFPVFSDLRDLKLWVLPRLIEDPRRELAELVAEFTGGYYGAAAGPIRRYLVELEQAVRLRPSPVRYGYEPPRHLHLSPEFLSRAHALFDAAESSVAGSAVLRQRVQEARLSLDRATLLRWDERLAAAGLDAEVVARRYRAVATRRVAARIPPAQAREALQRIAAETARWPGAAGG
jgi:hypothetical protein